MKIVACFSILRFLILRVLRCEPPQALIRTKLIMRRLMQSSREFTFVGFYLRANFSRVLASVLLVLLASVANYAQSDDDDIDPVKLFELGQNAHARGEFERAVEFYGQALALHPEFPEAEYQMASALLSLGRQPEAEKALKRATLIRPDWALPFASLGDLLVRQKRYSEAEPFLLNTLKLETDNPVALIALAEMRLQTKASRDVLMKLLNQLRVATSNAKANTGLWLARGSVERALGETDAALTSYACAVNLNPKSNTAGAALIARAEILASTGQIEKAIDDAKAAHRIAPSSIYVSTALARLYLQVGNCGDAEKTLDELDASTGRPSETASLRSVVTLECAKGEKERALLETALTREPRNTEVLARLCLLLRKVDPPRALEYCRRALEVQPDNVDYGTNYGAALVQARRFENAVVVLRRVLEIAPDKFVAHANLAIALYELKRLPEALVEYRWIRNTKPETTATYFFIAIIHDKLGQFQEALAAYEDFLRRADASDFKLEIEKINLRLPSLRNQIKRGEGVKAKK